MGAARRIRQQLVGVEPERVRQRVDGDHPVDVARAGREVHRGPDR
jgi:hypothetical protein